MHTMDRNRNMLALKYTYIQSYCLLSTNLRLFPELDIYIQGRDVFGMFGNKSMTSLK